MNLNSFLLMKPTAWFHTGRLYCFRPQACLSGVATTERNSPLVQWLKRNISPIIRKTNETRRIAPEDLDPKNASEWASWLPSFGLLQPLNSPSGEPLGILFLVRDRTWSDADIEILDVLAGAYGHAGAALVKPRKRRAGHGKKVSGIRGRAKTGLGR